MPQTLLVSPWLQEGQFQPLNNIDAHSSPLGNSTLCPNTPPKSQDVEKQSSFSKKCNISPLSQNPSLAATTVTTATIHVMSPSDAPSTNDNLPQLFHHSQDPSPSHNSSPSEPLTSIPITENDHFTMKCYKTLQTRTIDEIIAEQCTISNAMLLIHLYPLTILQTVTVVAFLTPIVFLYTFGLPLCVFLLFFLITICLIALSTLKQLPTLLKLAEQILLTTLSSPSYKKWLEVSLLDIKSIDLSGSTVSDLIALLFLNLDPDGKSLILHRLPPYAQRILTLTVYDILPTGFATKLAEYITEKQSGINIIPKSPITSEYTIQQVPIQSTEVIGGKSKKVSFNSIKSTAFTTPVTKPLQIPSFKPKHPLITPFQSRIRSILYKPASHGPIFDPSKPFFFAITAYATEHFTTSVSQYIAQQYPTLSYYSSVVSTAMSQQFGIVSHSDPIPSQASSHNNNNVRPNEKLAQSVEVDFNKILSQTDDISNLSTSTEHNSGSERPTCITCPSCTAPLHNHQPNTASFMGSIVSINLSQLLGKTSLIPTVNVEPQFSVPLSYISAQLTKTSSPSRSQLFQTTPRFIPLIFPYHLLLNTQLLSLLSIITQQLNKDGHFARKLSAALDGFSPHLSATEANNRNFVDIGAPSAIKCAECLQIRHRFDNQAEQGQISLHNDSELFPNINLHGHTSPLAPTFSECSVSRSAIHQQQQHPIFSTTLKPPIHPSNNLSHSPYTFDLDNTIYYQDSNDGSSITAHKTPLAWRQFYDEDDDGNIIQRSNNLLLPFLSLVVGITGSLQIIRLLTNRGYRRFLLRLLTLGADMGLSVMTVLALSHAVLRRRLYYENNKQLLLLQQDEHTNNIQINNALEEDGFNDVPSLNFANTYHYDSCVLYKHYVTLLNQQQSEQVDDSDVITRCSSCQNSISRSDAVYIILNSVSTHHILTNNLLEKENAPHLSKSRKLPKSHSSSSLTTMKSQYTSHIIDEKDDTHLIFTQGTNNDDNINHLTQNIRPFYFSHAECTKLVQSQDKIIAQNSHGFSHLTESTTETTTATAVTSSPNHFLDAQSSSISNMLGKCARVINPYNILMFLLKRGDCEASTSLQTPTSTNSHSTAFVQQFSVYYPLFKHYLPIFLQQLDQKQLNPSQSCSNSVNIHQSTPFAHPLISLMLNGNSDSPSPLTIAKLQQQQRQYSSVATDIVAVVFVFAWFLRNVVKPSSLLQNIPFYNLKPKL